jgi:Transglutaminase-like superfamily
MARPGAATADEHARGHDTSAARSLPAHLDQTVRRPPRGERPRVRALQLIRWCAGADPATMRAAFWALRACRRVRFTPDGGALAAPPLPAVPAVPGGALSGVEHVLWLRAERCLVRACVLQAWLAAHGQPHDVVVGVRLERPGDVRAHAWLGHEPAQAVGYEEIARFAPSARSGRPPGAH